MAGAQFNVPLSERYAVALRNLAIRDDCSIPDLLRPVIERHLNEVLTADSDLEKAVAALLRSKRKAQPSSSVSPIRQSSSGRK